MMKFRLTYIFLVAMLLTSCGNITEMPVVPDRQTSADSTVSNTPTPTFDMFDSVSDTSDVLSLISNPPSGTLEYLRAQTAQEGCLCAIAEMGYVNKDKTLESVIADSEVTAQYPFLASSELIFVDEGQVYAIVPVDPGGSVQIDQIEFAESDLTQIVVNPDGFHYKGGAEPFLLCCRESEFIGTVWITITDSQGRSVVIEPWHNGMNGYLNISSEVYDFTPYNDEELLEFVSGEVRIYNPGWGYGPWNMDDFNFSHAQAERLILGLRAMGWSTHKIIHFLNYTFSGDEDYLDYVGPVKEIFPCDSSE